MVTDAPRGGGAPLPAGVRTQFEPRLGHDFADVRVHTGAEAGAAARAIDARAYTIGRDIVFGEGQLQPDHRDGQHLLAHELVHVVQQGGGGQRASTASGSDHADARAHLTQAVAELTALHALATSLSTAARDLDGARHVAALAAGLEQLRALIAGGDGATQARVLAELTALLPPDVVSGIPGRAPDLHATTQPIVEQRAPGVAMAGLTISRISDPAEQEAERVADAVMGGAHVSVGAAAGDVVHRAGGPGEGNDDGGGFGWDAVVIAPIAALVAAIVAVLGWIATSCRSQSRRPRTVAEAIAVGTAVSEEETESRDPETEKRRANTSNASAPLHDKRRRKQERRSRRKARHQANRGESPSSGNGDELPSAGEASTLIAGDRGVEPGDPSVAHGQETEAKNPGTQDHHQEQDKAKGKEKAEEEEEEETSTAIRNGDVFPDAARGVEPGDSSVAHGQETEAKNPGTQDHHQEQDKAKGKEKVEEEEEETSTAIRNGDAATPGIVSSEQQPGPTRGRGRSARWRRRQAEQKQEREQKPQNDTKEAKQVTKNEDNNKSPRNRPAGLQLPRRIDDRAETIGRALDYCHHLRKSGKVLDHRNLDDKEAEIKLGAQKLGAQKLGAHMQELGLLLDAAEQRTVFRVQVGVVEGAALKELLREVDPQYTSSLEAGTSYGADGVIWYKEAPPVAIQAKRNDSPNPLEKQTWDSLTQGRKSDIVPFRDQLAEASNQLAGRVAEGSSDGWENPPPGSRLVACIRLSKVSRPPNVDCYREAAEAELAMETQGRNNPAWNYVDEIWIDWSDKGRTILQSNHNRS